MTPFIDECSGHMLKCPALGYAHAKLCILSNPDCLVEQPDIFNNLPSHNDTGRNNRPIKQKICRQRIALIRAIAANGHGHRIGKIWSGKVDQITIDESCLAPVAEGGQLTLELVLSPEIIAVEKCNKITGSMSDCKIPRR